MSSGAGSGTVILSPHYDDAVLSCFSLLVAEPAPRVVNIFGGVPAGGPPPVVSGRRRELGSYWWDRTCGITDSRRHVARRRTEDAAALGTLGIVPTNLDHLDAQYRPEDPGLDELLVALDRVVDASDVVYVPLSASSHPDHELVLRLGEALLDRGGAVAVFADIPHVATLSGWPCPTDSKWKQMCRHHERRGRTKQVVELPRVMIERKREVCLKYASQMAALETTYEPRLLSDDVLGTEVFFVPHVGRTS